MRNYGKAKKFLNITLKTAKTALYILFLICIIICMLLAFTFFVDNGSTEFEKYMRYNSNAPGGYTVIWFIIAVVNFVASLIFSKIKNRKIQMFIHLILGIICVVCILSIVFTANFVYKTKL